MPEAGRGPVSRIGTVGVRRAGRPRWRLAGVVLLLLASPGIALGGWATWLHAYGNLHLVEPGRLYRSGQLGGAQLQLVLQEDGIRSVINLRGPEDGGAWYQDEIRATRNAGAVHYDLALSAETPPGPATIAKLVDLLRTAPEPMLVHCRDGADRTGLAAALYELLVMRRTPQQAKQQLSFYYGHFPWLGSPTAAMDVAFDAVAASRPGS